MLEGVEFLPVPLALPLQLLGNLLLQDKGLEGIITLLLRASEADRQPGGVVLLLVEETSQTAILALVTLDLDLEVLGLLVESVGKGLEFEELGFSLARNKRTIRRPCPLTCCFQLSNSSMR